MNKDQKLVIDTIKDLFEKDESLELTDVICRVLKESIYTIDAEDHDGVTDCCFPIYQILNIKNEYFVELLVGLPEKEAKKKAEIEEEISKRTERDKRIEELLKEFEEIKKNGWKPFYDYKN